ncbi:transposase [Flammeovirga yaeyamensis]|uniref:Transposase n=1 Tax=Flammeovirga yaeyamensis TaxID=367791 RepID=A0AAX1MZC6_9BACT|nr:transposase [Flammeovirga yaeyamensis]MBB3701557.1 transposase-like protein [Flammeovirga yaeyamensis]QWG00594.1 transposase [Flammeovirga yaeyamensis]QWG00959.1 transposase [Flammeovirga yaeyamensis]QWG01559.1 transposase [Flammeovirga yaeyamensis]QWG02367.1 transposase [Flammeovirga yaeyamensis]
MEENKNQFIKRTQKDYPMSLKLQIVSEVENGQLGLKAAQRKYGIQGNQTVKIWLQKYGNFDWNHKVSAMKKKTPEQELLELKLELETAKKKIKRLEAEAEKADHKSIIFDMMIDLAEKEYKIDIRKNSSPK